MSIAARIFALILAITSLAVPCFSEISGHKTYALTEKSQSRICDGAGDSCRKELPQAVLSRNTNTVKYVVTDLTAGNFFRPTVSHYQKPNSATAQKVATNRTNCKAVNLYVLCRQLN